MTDANPQPSAQPQPLSKGDLGLRYKVEDQPFAVGNMGQIWAAWDNELGREIAVKCMRPELIRNPEARRRFRREIEVLAHLSHPGICQPFARYLLNDPPCFTMKRLYGQTLRQRIRECQQEPDESRRMAKRLQLLEPFLAACNAVAYAHSRGVIHRDLKPDNIMVGDFGETVVLDWGLARLATEDDSREADATNVSSSPMPQSPSGTVGGSVMGTPCYMAPEQARGELNEVDELSDVYSLGAILYEILSGQAPYGAGSGSSPVEQVLTDDPAPLHDIARLAPPELRALASHAMARHRDERLQSVELMAQELGAFRDGRTLSSYQYRSTELLRRFFRRNRVASKVGALAIVLLGGVIAWSLVSISDQRDRAETALTAREQLEAQQKDERKRLVGVRRQQLEEQKGRLIALEPRSRFEAASTLLTDLEKLSVDERHRCHHLKIDAAQLVESLLEAASTRREVIRLAGEPVAGVVVELLPAHELTGHRDALLSERILAAELAAANSDFGLAQVILSATEGPPHALEDAQSRLAEAKGGLLRQQAARINAVLEDIRTEAGLLGRVSHEERLDGYVAELIGYRERQTVDLLADALEKHTVKAKQQGREATWTNAERQELAVICRALGFLMMGDLAAPPLVRFLDVIWDRELAILCGQSLCYTRATAAIDGLLRFEIRMASLDTEVWDLIQPYFHLVPAPPVGTAPLTAEGHVRFGWIHYFRSEWKQAEEQFNSALKKESAHANALVGRGLSRDHLQRHEDAIDDLSKAIGLEPERLGTYSRRALIYMKAGKLDRALEDYNHVITRDGRDANALTMRGWIRLANNELEAALDDLTKACSVAPHSAGVLIARGVAWERLEEPQNAAVDYTRAIELDSQCYEALTNRGYLRYELKDYPGAIRDFTRAIDVSHRGMPGGFVLVGQDGQPLGMPPGAWYAGNAPKQLESGELIPYLGRGRCYSTIGEFTKAEADYRHVLELDDSNPAALNGLGIVHYRKGERTEAVALFSKAIAADPRPYEALGNRAEVFVDLGRLDDAMADVDRAIELDRTRPEAFVTRGRVFANKGDFEAAARNFTQAHTNDPAHAMALVMRGSAHEFLGRKDLALEDYTAAIQLREPVALVNRGRIYLDEGKLDEAKQDFERAIALKIKDPMAYINLGNVYAKEGNTEKAISLFNDAISLDDRLADAYRNRGLAYCNLNKFEEALADFTKAIQVDDNHVMAYYDRGLLLHEQGDLDGAIRDYSKAIALDDKLRDAYNNRGEAYMVKGEMEAALADFNKSVLLQPKNPYGYFNRGVFYMETGDRDSAVKEFTAAIEIDERVYQAWAERGNVRFYRGDFADAAKDFRKAIELNSRPEATFESQCLVILAGVQLGELKAALEDANRVISYDTSRPSSYQLRACVYRASKAWREAISDFTKSIELAQAVQMEPDIDCILGRGACRIELEDLESAREDIAAALKIVERSRDEAPEDPNGFYTLACVLAQSSRAQSSPEASAKELNAAFDWLRKAAQAGVAPKWRTDGDPDLAPLRGDPRYLKLHEGG